MHGAARGWNNDHVSRHQVFGAHSVDDSSATTHVDDVTATHRVPQLFLVLQRISIVINVRGNRSVISTHSSDLRDRYDDTGSGHEQDGTGKVIITNGYPNGDGNNLKDVERIQHFEQQQLHNTLHWNVNQVGTIDYAPVE